MTAKPGVLQFMELQKVEHDLVTEQQQQLICLGCHNKALQIGWLIEQTFMSSQFWRSRIKVSAGFASPGGSLLGSQMPPFCSPVSSWGLFLVCAPLVSCLILTRTPVLLDQGLALFPHLTLIISLKALPPNPVALGVRTSNYEF